MICTRQQVVDCLNRLYTVMSNWQPLHYFTSQDYSPQKGVDHSFLTEQLSAYQNKTHFPITHLICTIEHKDDCRLPNVLHISESEFGAAGNLSTHLLLSTK